MTENKPKIIWGSEGDTPTGYAIVSNKLLPLLADDFEIHRIGWQHVENDVLANGVVIHSSVNGEIGNPHVLWNYIKKIEPDLISSLVDIWFCRHWASVCQRSKLPYLCYFPVDGFPLSRGWIDIFKNISDPLCMSNFGKKVTEKSIKEMSGAWGQNFRCDYIHHGVDNKIFYEWNKNQRSEFEEVNKNMMKHIEGKFIFGQIGRNVERKQLDRLIRAFAIVKNEIKDSILYLRVGDPLDNKIGRNLVELMMRHGFKKGDIVFGDVPMFDMDNNPFYSPLDGIPEKMLINDYNLIDVHVYPTGGEGFGLGTLEAMACGTPSIIADNTTASELVGGERPSPWKEDDLMFNKNIYTGNVLQYNPARRGVLVPCIDHFNGAFNVSKSLVNIDKLAEAMLIMHDDNQLRKRLGKACKPFAREHDWTVIADKFRKKINYILER